MLFWGAVGGALDRSWTGAQGPAAMQTTVLQALGSVSSSSSGPKPPKHPQIRQTCTHPCGCRADAEGAAPLSQAKGSLSTAGPTECHPGAQGQGD